MGTVECGKVDYLNYCGEITLKRKGGGTIKFAKAKNFDEEIAAGEKQKIGDGDSVITGRKSFITISGTPEDNKTQIVSLYPDSEIVIRTKEWKAEVKGEKRTGCGISKVEVVRGTVLLYPGGAQIEAPLVEIDDRNKDKGRSFSLFLDVVQGMTVVLPGSKMEVKSKATGQRCETYPAYGSIGMTELLVTGSGMYEKSMEVDERASKLAGMLLIGGLVRPPDLAHEEDMTNYMARKMKEGKAKNEENMKHMASEADLEKMKKEGKITDSQAELSRAMSKAMKSGAPGSMVGINMLASMDFSKLRDMPGLTPEQRKQLEEGMPQFEKMQKELNAGGKLAQLNAQAKLSEKYIETAAADPVAKKKREAAYAQIREKIDSFDLPPYPKPDEKFRVK